MNDTDKKHMITIRSIRTASLWLATLSSVALLSVPHTSFAQDPIIIYRCTDASGGVTLQNGTPCPKGSKQEIRKVGAVSTAPAPRPAAPVAPAAAVDHSPSDFTLVRGPQIDAAVLPAGVERKPPAALYQCRTWDDRDYFSDTAAPPAACVPMQAVGIDGSSQLAAGQACEMRQDACSAIPAEQRCTNWKRRVDEAEFRWKFAGSQLSDPRKADYERWLKMYRESDCVR